MRRHTNGKETGAGRPPKGVRASAEGSEHLLLALLLLGVSCASAAVLYHIDRHSFLYFGDAVSHLVRARQFVDSQHPGLQNIGTVWLPLPHLVLLPFAVVDAFFYSGVAGALVGIPCLVGTSILLVLIVRRITGSGLIAFFSGCLFGLNPNLLYMALTPMNELLFIFLLALGGYALLRWVSDEGEYWLWGCAVAVALASLCRYEAWLLVPFVSIVSGGRGISSWRRREHRAAVRSFAIAGMSWAGIAFWLCWNLAVYGDPLEFARWTYAVGQGAARPNVNLSPAASLVIFGRALLVIFGPVLLLTATGAFVRSQAHPPERSRRALLLAFFALPAAFALAAILVGFVQVDQWSWNWRYVLTASPFLAVAAGMGLSGFFHDVRSAFARGLVLVGLLAMPVVQMTLPSVGVATYHDAQRSISDNTRFVIALGERLRGFSAGGSVALLTGFGEAQRIMISSGLPLKQFHIIYNAREADILGSLVHSERYLVIGKDRTPESERVVADWLSRRDELLRSYDIRFEDEHHLLMERKSGMTPSSLPPQR